MGSDHLCDQPRLPDSGLAGQQHHPELAAAGRDQVSLETSTLGRPAHEAGQARFGLMSRRLDFLMSVRQRHWPPVPPSRLVEG
jgi:hypothetical protein